MTEEESAKEEETVSEEEVVEEEPTTEAPKNDCLVIPDHMKPLFECCKEFDEGKIDSGDFFARASIRTGEFMQNAKKKRETETHE